MKFANVEQRLRSYENIPLPKGQDREVLAAAGFHYVGESSIACMLDIVVIHMSWLLARCCLRGLS